MIVRSTSGNRELRIGSTPGLNALLSGRGIDPRSTATPVSYRKLVGLPAANLALRLASTAVAELELAVFRGDGALRRRVRSTWQARFFAGQPNPYESWSALLAKTETSITGRNSAFWRLDVDTAGRPVYAHFLPRDVVEARWSPTEDRPEYRYKTASGSMLDWTSTRIIHFRTEHVEEECIIPPTPVEIARELIAAMLAKPTHASRTLDRSGGRQIALSYPIEVSPEQAERYRVILEPLLTGANSAGNVRVFGGNPSISTIGLSFADMQFVEMMQLDAEQIGQLFAVMPSLLGVMKNDRPLSPEHEETRWDRYYLGPRRTRIENTLFASRLFFGPGSKDRPSFITPKVRGDVKTQALALVSLVQSGILLADDARGELGYDDLPDGLGKIPQVTPVGGAPNPVDLLLSPEPAEPAES